MPACMSMRLQTERLVTVLDSSMVFHQHTSALGLQRATSSVHKNASTTSHADEGGGRKGGEQRRRGGERGILVKVPLGLSKRLAGRPHSAASPLSMTRTMSQSMIVCNLRSQQRRVARIIICILICLLLDPLELVSTHDVGCISMALILVTQQL